MDTFSWRESFRLWGKIGLLSFGGPAAQISMMHQLVIEDKKWLSEKAFLHALSFCMLLPGPEAMQLATYIGWRLKGIAGGLLAGLLFVLPGAIIIMTLAWLYVIYGQTITLQNLFLGVKAAVIIVVFNALIKVAKNNLHGLSDRFIAITAFLGLFCFNLPFPLMILLAGLYGFFIMNGNQVGDIPTPASAPLQRTLITIILWVGLWFLPLVLLYLLSEQTLLIDIGLFFAKLSTVTFGGAYAVLSYMAQDAVQHQKWLTHTQMIDGLGLAETTPGPLILVTQFVGFLAGAGSQQPPNIALGLVGALLTLWMTFVPSFLFIFAGAPYIEWITSKYRLKSALCAISAAVVGGMLNLALWFALHTLFAELKTLNEGYLALPLPVISSTQPMVLALALFAAILFYLARLGVMSTIIICALTSLLVSSVF